jgi:DNA-binding GntR family transcriptional regulator
MFEVMGEFEGMCGRLAARRLTDEEQKELVATHEECKAAMQKGGDPDEYYQLNDKFHGVIYRGSHNEFLMEQAWGPAQKTATLSPLAVACPRPHSDFAG